ncbi:hypothetical protein [Variovorax sp. ZT4R33]|uniref:hypothetical protein n=1 Tax=Variovorax sp. ZT4R33 TaxID=3443743 RepID=UPI003F48411B
MPFNLLTCLAHSSLPRTIADAEEIDMVRVLSEAGLVRARLPGLTDHGDLPQYTGCATVLEVTARGRNLSAKAGTARPSADPLAGGDLMTVDPERNYAPWFNSSVQPFF